MLAELGYTALAVDMYGGGKQAMHPEDAGKFSSEVMKNFDTAKARFTAAMNFLKKQPTVDPKRIAAIGYCFGGAIVLNMARQGADLKGVASFHGNLTAVKPAEKGKVKAKIRVYNGADDTFIPEKAVNAILDEAARGKPDFEATDDLGETQDLAPRLPAKVRELNARIDAFLKETGAVVPQPNPAYNRTL